MNALINSQKEEFDKFLSQVPDSHIRVERYTGQESLAKKTENSKQSASDYPHKLHDARADAQPKPGGEVSRIL